MTRLNKINSELNSLRTKKFLLECEIDSLEEKLNNKENNLSDVLKNIEKYEAEKKELVNFLPGFMIRYRVEPELDRPYRRRVTRRGVIIYSPLF